MDNKPILEFKGINKRFGQKQVLRGLSLKIFKKDCFALVGRSGAGKSTLMKILIGFYKPDSGKVIYDGEDISGDLNKLRKIIGFTTQENSFYEELSVIENMKYYSRLYELNKKDEELTSILRAVGLDNAKDIMAGRISGGMKRRLDFAISLIHDPEILILDEPTTGLDPILVEAFWEIIQDIRKKGKTIIVTSHIFEELEKNCNQIGILEKGKFSVVDSISSLKRRCKTDSLAKAFKKVIG